MFSLIKQVYWDLLGINVIFMFSLRLRVVTIKVPGLEEVILKPSKRQHLSGRLSDGRILFYKLPSESK